MARIGRREQILEAAKSLFSVKGYHATTMRDIADASGMLSGSLYAHISTKEDLLFEIVNRQADEFLSAITPIVTGPGTAADKLRQALTAHIRVVARASAAATVFLHEWQALDPPRRAVIQEKRDQYESYFAGMVAAGVASGELRGVSVRFARLMVLSVANWVYQWYRPDGELSAEEIAGRLSDMILHGLLAAKGEDR